MRISLSHMVIAVQSCSTVWRGHEPTSKPSVCLITLRVASGFSLKRDNTLIPSIRATSRASCETRHGEKGASSQWRDAPFVFQKWAGARGPCLGQSGEGRYLETF